MADILAADFLDAKDERPSASDLLDAPHPQKSASDFLDEKPSDKPDLTSWSEVSKWLSKPDPTMGQYAGAAAIGEGYALDNPEITASNLPTGTPDQNIDTGAKFKQAYETPLVTLPKPENTGLVSGITRGVENTAEGLVTPENIAIISGLGAAPKIIQSLASGGFSVAMIKGAYDQAMEAANADTPGKKAEGITQAILSLALGGLAGKHAISGRLTTGEGPRPPSFTQDQADSAIRTGQLRDIQASVPAEPLARDTNGSPLSADPSETLKGLLVNREALTKGFNSLSTEHQAARQLMIDDLDKQISNASATGVATRDQAPPSQVASPETAPAPEVPPAKGNAFQRLREAEQAAAESPPEPPSVRPGTQEQPQSTTEPAAASGEGAITDPAMHQAAEASAQSIADAVTQGQPTAVRDAAYDAAIDNARSSMASGKPMSAKFMRASAKEAAGKAAAKQGESLDAPVGEGEQTRADTEAAPTTVTNEELYKPLNDVLDSVLSPRDAKIVRAMQDPDATLDAVGKQHGISKERVRQIVKESLETIRDGLREKGITKADWGGPGAMGPLEALEMKLRDAPTTALNYRSVNIERLRQGLEPTSAPARQHEEGVIRDAEDLATDETAAPSLVSRIVDDGDTAISEKDAALLLVERTRLMNERAAWEDRLGRGEDVETARARLTEIEAQQERLDQAQRAAGSTWGRLGHMYQRLLRDDYTLEGMERKARAAKQRPLTPEESATIKEQATKIEELQKQLDESRAASEQTRESAETQRIIESTINELGKSYLKEPKFSRKVFDIAKGIVDRWKTEADEARERLKTQKYFSSGGLSTAELRDLAIIARSYIGEFGLKGAELADRLVQDFGEKVRQHARKIESEANRLIGSEKTDPTVKKVVSEGVSTKGEPTEVQAKARAKAEAVAGEPVSHETVFELVKALIKSGIHGEEPLMKAAHEALKESHPGITERDVRRAYTDYGHKIYPSKEEIAVEMAQIRQEIKINEDITREMEGLQGIVDPKTGELMKAEKQGFQRPKPTQKVRDLIKQRNELLKKRQGPPSPEALASRDEAKQTALKNAIEDLDRQLRTGQKPVKGEPAPDSVKTEQLRAELSAMREKLREVEDAANPPTPEHITQLKNLYERIDHTRDRLARMEIERPPGKATVDTKEIAEAKAELKTLNDTIAELRNPTPKTDAEKQVEQLVRTRDQASKRLNELSEILAGKRPPNTPKDWNPLTDIADDLQAEVQGIREITAQMKRENPTEIEKSQIRILEKAIKDLDAKIASGKAATNPKVFGPGNVASVLVSKLKAIKDARAKVYKAMVKAGKPVRSPEEVYNATRVKALEKRSAELDDRLARKDLSKPVKNAPPVKSKETLKLEEEVARKQQEFNKGVEKDRLANRTPSQKFWDHFVGIERAMKLSSDVVIGKLTSAAILREVVLTPAEEVVGGVISRVLPRLAQRAPREGGFSRDAEIKAKAAFFTSGMKDAWDNLRMRSSELEVKYGKERNANPSWYDYFGFLHSALKAAVKRAEFERSLAKRIKSTEDHGVNTNDIGVMGRISQEAYLNGESSIFMQDNVVSSGFSGLLKIMENNKKAKNLGPALARLGRFLIPIVKVPTNIVGEVATGVHGLATGGVRAAKAYYDGVDSLPPEQADAIMRQLKKGLIGNALLITGYLGYKNIGGFYQSHDDRDASDVQPEHFRVGKANLPSFVSHSTAAMLLDIGASFRREEIRKGIPSAFSAAGTGVVKQLPFIPAATNITNALESDHSFQKYVRDMVASSVVPAILSHAAKLEDTPGHLPSNAFVPATKRYPTNVEESLKAAVPVLRRQVPDRPKSRR